MITKSFIELALPLIIAFLISFCLIESIYPYYESYTTWHRYGIYENVSRHLSRTSLLGNTLSLCRNLYPGIPFYLLLSDTKSFGA